MEQTLSVSQHNKLIIPLPAISTMHIANTLQSKKIKHRDESSCLLLSTAEQRVKIAASEHRREYNEEQRNEYENYAEEDRDEVNERSRETNEQLREYNYDGLYPRYYWFH
uniref:Unique cartilage matrix-associated protein n=1 Tax=Seriola dumerili TaxID=41447 RepID=A0A3B4UP49_SERDU